MKFLKYLFLTVNLFLILGAYSENINDIRNKSFKRQTFEKDYEISLEDYIKWEIVPEDEESQKNLIRWEIVPENEKIQEKLNINEKNFYSPNSENFKYSPSAEDTYLRPLEKKDKLISFGGITVNNALLPNNRKGQYGINYDSNSNYHISYSYSLSNIFQLELINLGSINNTNNNKYINKTLTDNYLDEDNFNIRVGGKLLLFSPQKEDTLWTSLRTSVGRNESSNQGYIFSELINTYRINNWLAANLSAKYFYSGIEKFGAFGASMYLNVTDNLQIIPEINYLLDENVQSNNTIAIRYSFSENKSIDLYSSNALNTQDLGQLLKSTDNKFGIKLNLFY